MVSRFEGPLSRGIRILYLISKEFAGYLCWFTTRSFAKPGPGSFPDLAIFFGGGPSYFLGKCNDCREIEFTSLAGRWGTIFKSESIFKSQLTLVLVHLGNQLGLHVIAVPTALVATLKVVQIYIGSNFSNPGFPHVTIYTINGS